MSSTKLGVAPGDGPIFFWHEYEMPHAWMSQWYECHWEHEGIDYQSTEMWMMVQKAKLFNDEETAQNMLKTTSPAGHQLLGRQVKQFEKEVWDQNKGRIVEEGNWWKFTKSKDCKRLADLLLKTGDRELVEASSQDRIWGVGYTAENAEANRENWGQNLLGKVITRVRTRLREASEAGEV